MKFDQYAENYDAGWRGTKSARFYEDLIKELEINPGDAVLESKTRYLIQFIDLPVAYLQAG